MAGQGRTAGGSGAFLGMAQAMSHISRAHPLVQEFRALAEKQRMSLTRITMEAGLGERTISGWSIDRSPTVANLEAALNVIGYRLVIVPVETGSRRA